MSVCACVCRCMCVHVSVCVDGMNLKCALLLHIYTAVHSVQCQRTHTHARYLGTANRRGLQVDTAGIVCVCVCVCERERERDGNGCVWILQAAKRGARDRRKEEKEKKETERNSPTQVDRANGTDISCTCQSSVWCCWPTYTHTRAAAGLAGSVETAVVGRVACLQVQFSLHVRISTDGRSGDCKQ